MGYYEHLWRMLGPLGVYSADGYSGGELRALGAALDQAEACLRENFREMIPMQAEGEGLEMAMDRFPVLEEPETVEEKRKALQTLASLGNEDFHAAALEKTFAACGLKVGITDTGVNGILVVFQELLTRKTDISGGLSLLRNVLPCRGEIECMVRYISGETGETVTERKSLRELQQRTKAQWDGLIAE